MGDVADMLGIMVQKPNAPVNAAEEAIKYLSESKTSKSEQKLSSKGIKKPKGMKREVFDLIGKGGMVPAMQSTSTSAPIYKTKRIIASKGKWIYVPIESSARHNDQLTCKHWVKADVNYTDYPYAKFNVKLEKVELSDDEYHILLNDEAWSKADSNTLLEACYVYDLRWPVIFDRVGLTLNKTLEEMQHRFYTIVNKLYVHRDPSGLHDKKLYEYDIEKETKRRVQQDLNFKRTREEEQEELKLREELKFIDATIKKNKKTTKATSTTGPSGLMAISDQSKLADTVGSSIGGPTGAINNAEIGGVLLATVTNPIMDIIPTPQSGKPGLQSSRLFLCDGVVPVAKSMVIKMNAYLKELNIPERPVATKRVCDLIDQIRKDTVLLISLHNSIKKKEKELVTAKGGNTRNQGKGQPKVKQEKLDTKDMKEKIDKPDRPRKTSNKKSNSLVATDIDESALDSFGADLLPLDGKDEFGDLLDVFDTNESFHDVEVKSSSKPPSTKKRVRSTKTEPKMEEIPNFDMTEVPAPAKKKTKKTASTNL